MLGDYPVRIWHASHSRSRLRCHLDDHSTNQTEKCAAYRPHQNEVEPLKYSRTCSQTTTRVTS